MAFPPDDFVPSPAGEVDVCSSLDICEEVVISEYSPYNVPPLSPVCSPAPRLECSSGKSTDPGGGKRSKVKYPGGGKNIKPPDLGGLKNSKQIDPGGGKSGKLTVPGSGKSGKLTVPGGGKSGKPADTGKSGKRGKPTDVSFAKRDNPTDAGNGGKQRKSSDLEGKKCIKFTDIGGGKQNDVESGKRLGKILSPVKEKQSKVKEPVDRIKQIDFDEKGKLKSQSKSLLVNEAKAVDMLLKPNGVEMLNGAPSVMVRLSLQLVGTRCIEASVIGRSTAEKHLSTSCTSDCFSQSTAMNETSNQTNVKRSHKNSVKSVSLNSKLLSAKPNIIRTESHETASKGKQVDLSKKGKKEKLYPNHDVISRDQSLPAADKSQSSNNGALSLPRATKLRVEEKFGQGVEGMRGGQGEEGTKWGRGRRGRGSLRVGSGLVRGRGGEGGVGPDVKKLCVADVWKGSPDDR